MLHYSNASTREKNRQYLVIKGGGLAWLLWKERGVVNSVDERGGSSIGLVVYGREEGKKLLGNVAEIQNFLRITKINLWSNLETREGECIYIPL